MTPRRSDGEHNWSGFPGAWCLDCGSTAEAKGKKTPCGVPDDLRLGLACIAPYGHRGVHQYDCAEVSRRLRAQIRQEICAVVCNCGPNQEPLACGYRRDHAGEHSWALLPTFSSPPTPNADEE